VLDLLMAAGAQRPCPSVEKRLDGAAVWLMTIGAVAIRRRHMDASASRLLGLNLVAFRAYVADIGGHEVLPLGGMWRVAGRTVSVREGKMLIHLGHRRQDGLVTIPAKRHALCLEKSRSPRVGEMTRRAASRRHRRVDHGQTGACAHAGVTFATKLLLRGQEQAREVSPVRAVTVEALAARRRVDGIRPRACRILVTVHAQIARL
jgi:hypothetical protein